MCDNLPLDMKKLDLLLKELKHLENNELRVKVPKIYPSMFTNNTNSTNRPKKPFLFSTEIKAYFDISHYYQLVILSIDDISIALEVWIKGILPILLLRHGIDLEEWDRICSFADSIKTIEQELSQDWELFLEKIVRHGYVNRFEKSGQSWTVDV